MCVWTVSIHSSQTSWQKKDGKMQNLEAEQDNQRKSTTLQMQVGYQHCYQPKELADILAQSFVWDGSSAAITVLSLWLEPPWNRRVETALKHKQTSTEMPVFVLSEQCMVWATHPCFWHCSELPWDANFVFSSGSQVAKARLTLAHCVSAAFTKIQYHS